MKKRIFALSLALSCLIMTLPSSSTYADWADLTTDLTYLNEIQKAPSADYLDVDEYVESEDLKSPDLDKAGSAVLIDKKTGRALYGKKAKQRMFPASTTKIMTAIVALELLAQGGYTMDDVIEAQTEAILPITSDDSHMGILIGEKLTVENLLYGLLVYSANDAANVLAVELAGSMNAFVDIMNQKAEALGMTGTHFANVCGLHDDNHYTTAYDLAIVARYAMQNETFAEIVKTPMYTMPPTNKYTEERNLSNTNLFLSKYRSSYYEDTDHYFGIKTGHTDAAGYCLVTNAKHTPDSGEELDFICVVMNCKDTDVNDGAFSYITTKNLVNFGFNNYEYKTVHKAGETLCEKEIVDAKQNTKAILTTNGDVYALLPKHTSLDDIDVTYTINKNIAPIAEGESIGQVEFQFNGHELTTYECLSANEVKLNIPLHIYHVTIDFLKKPAVIIAIIILAILFLLALVIRARNERRKRLRRLRSQQRRRERSSTPAMRKSQSKTPANNERNASSMYTTKRD